MFHRAFHSDICKVFRPQAELFAFLHAIPGHERHAPVDIGVRAPTHKTKVTPAIMRMDPMKHSINRGKSLSNTSGGV